MLLSPRLRLPAVSLAAALTGALLPGAVAAAAPRPWSPGVATAPLASTAPAAAPAVARPGELTAVLTLAQTPAQRDLVSRLARHLVPGRPGLLRAALPADAERSAVTRWAGAHGFRVLDSRGFMVQVAGAPQRLADALGTRVAPTRFEGGTYLAKTRAAVVPAALRTAVTSVAGLDSRPLFHPHVKVGPPEVRALSNQANPTSPAATGSGITVGTLQLHTWTSKDVTTWAANPKGDGTLTPEVTDPIGSHQVTEVPVSGPNPPVDDYRNGPGGEEVALDVEALLASAPAAKQRVYFTTNNSAGMLAALNQMATDAIAGNLQVASTSWGSCEPPNGAAADDFKAIGAAIDKLVASGVTFFAASGDSGAYDCGDNSLAVDFPASWPTTVAVGGVHATSSTGTAGDWSFSAWGPANTAGISPSNVSGGGGGYSSYFGRPSYQDQASSDNRRAVPDISGLADPATGMIAYVTRLLSDGSVKSGYVQGGGTSLAAPLSAGGLAAVLSANKRTTGYGDIHQALYDNPADFQPVASGTNGYYAAGACYNPATGLGVPDWTALAKALAAPAVLSATGCTASTTVTLTYTGDKTSPDAYATFDESGPAPTCSATMGPGTPPTSFTLNGVAGMHRIGLLAHDRATGTCTLYETSSFLDVNAPVARPLSVSYVEGTTPRFAISYGFDFPQPSAGLRYYDVTIHDDSTGRDVVHDDLSPENGGVLRADPGHRYTVSVRAVSNAGLASGVARSSFQAPWDDTQLARRGFRSVRAAQAYNGSYSVASKKGARIGLRFTGSRAQVGFTTGPRMGTVDVFLDGRKVRTVDTYARQTGFRQRLLTLALRAGTHNLVLVVTGKHSRRSRGTSVGVDLVSVS